MNKSFFKSFYFYFTLSLLIIFIPTNLMLDWSKGQSSKGLLANVIKLMETIDNKMIDIKFKAKNSKSADPKIVVVAIDEHSLKELGRWQSWSREFYAQTIAKLDQHGARVVGFDVVFDSPDENAGYKFLGQLEENYPKMHQKSNEQFQQALAQAKMFANTDWMLEEATKTFNQDGKAVVFGHFIQADREYKDQGFGDMPKKMRVLLRSAIPFKPHDQIPIELKKTVKNFGINFKSLAKSSSHHGFFSMSPDEDGVVRHYQLFHSIYGSVFPSLSLKMIESYWNSPVVIEKLGNTGVLALSMNGKKKFAMPVSSSGKVRVNYVGRQNSFKTISLADLINNEDEINYFYNESKQKKYKAAKSELLKDAIVLIGATAIGIFDVRNTPIQVNLPGVEVHATMLNQFLTKDFFGELADLKLIALVILKAFLILFLSWIIFKRGAIGAVLTTLFVLLLYTFWDYQFLFLNNKIVFQTPFYIAVVLNYLVLNSYKFLTEEREKQFIKNTFKNYVSGDVVQQMLDEPDSIKIGGESKELTIMFTDIAGFSTISEKLTPGELSTILNIYLTRMTDIIFSKKGTLDKFIGDAIMCFWGAPIEIEDHTILACETALEMKLEQDKINQEIKSYGVELYTRIGLNTDTVAVGNMGSETQFAYTCLGDGVNLSSRLEGANKQYGTMIMVSENTYQKVSDKFVFRKLDKVKVVGKDQSVVVYELVGRIGEVKEEIMKEVAGFETALDFYFAGDFANAIEKFSKLPEGKTNEVFIDRCKYLINNANTIKWEGVWEMTSK